MIPCLVLHGDNVKNASTIADYLSSYRLMKSFVVSILPIGVVASNPSFDFERFNVIIIHHDINLSHCKYLRKTLQQKIAQSSALKCVVVQDDYECVKQRVDVLESLQTDILFTCVPRQYIERVYNSKGLSKTKKVTVLTGYVPSDLLGLTHPDFQSRDNDVVYRARKLSAAYGRLAQEKWKIAEQFENLTSSYNLKLDISCDSNKRIYGNKWLRFLQNAKAVLGTESGASVFDFEGDLLKRVMQYEAAHPDATYEQIESIYFKDLDGIIPMNQISPRCFECAALKTMMVLYEGHYSGVLQPWRHYVPLKKDGSNIKEVVNAIQSEERWTQIVNTAYNEIALNPEYNYSALAEIFNTTLLQALSECDNCTIHSGSDAEKYARSQSLFYYPYYTFRKKYYLLRMHMIHKLLELFRLIERVFKIEANTIEHSLKRLLGKQVR